MKFRTLLKKFSLGLVLLVTVVGPLNAQKPGRNVPREEKLLNGLRLLMWTDRSAPDVRVSIRIHSGSAFDPQGKEGVMKLLAENLFPTRESRDFFSENLGGNLEVVSNYDFIQINASARASEFIDLFETLAQAVSQPTIDKDTTEALQKVLTAEVAALEKDPNYVAEQATLKRLFGAFPYGRPQMGSVDTIRRIDFAELIFAKERFLSADNATVAISGNFDPALGFRAARRYFGAWLKSDKRVPATFRQPDPPDSKPLELTVNGGSPVSNFALRGVSRSGPDYFASLVLEKILAERGARVPAVRQIANHARTLPGVVLISLSGTSEFPSALLNNRITEAEFAKARGMVTADHGRRSLVDQWLDVDTYRTTVAADNLALQNMRLPDVQKLADRLAKNPVASVIVKPAVSAQ